jgi:hypothetical protein
VRIPLVFFAAFAIWALLVYGGKSLISHFGWM